MSLFAIMLINSVVPDIFSSRCLLVSRGHYCCAEKNNLATWTSSKSKMAECQDRTMQHILWNLTQCTFHAHFCTFIFKLLSTLSSLVEVPYQSKISFHFRRQIFNAYKITAYSAHKCITLYNAHPQLSVRWNSTYFLKSFLNKVPRPWQTNKAI